MQSNTTSTQAGRVKGSGKAQRELFYFQKFKENWGEDVANRFLEWRKLSWSEQANKVTRRQFEHIRWGIKNAGRTDAPSFADKFFKNMEGKLISIEMECIFDEKDEMPKARDLGTFMVTMCDDGSIRTNSETNGSAEVKVTISQNSPMRLKKVTDKLLTHGGCVNSSCGMHIHLDQRGVSYLTASKRAKRLIKALPALMKLVAPSRLTNNYCVKNQPIPTHPTQQYRHSTNRYRMINFLPAYDEHKTIEVRLHGGTLDFYKILGWVNLCQFICDCTEIDRIALNNAKEFSLDYLQIDIANLLEMEKLPEALRAYVWKRFRQFHPSEAHNLREKFANLGKFHLTDGMAIS